MKIKLKIIVNKPTSSGRIFPIEICENIVKQLNSPTTPVFVMNKVELTKDTDMSRAVGNVIFNTAHISPDGEICANINFYKSQIALAQPYDALKYPRVGTFDGGKGNAVEQLALEGGLDFRLVGVGSVGEDLKTVKEYIVKYIHTEPI
jgi:hypothetical protein